jgi:hypothetical protein
VGSIPIRLRHSTQRRRWARRLSLALTPHQYNSDGQAESSTPTGILSGHLFESNFNLMNLKTVSANQTKRRHASKERP